MATPTAVRSTTVKIPAWQYRAVGVLSAAAVGYSVACAFAAAAVYSLRSLALQILAGQHPDAITIEARLHAESHAHAEYVAMRAAQRAVTPTPVIPEATTPASAAGEMAIDAPVE